MEKQRRSSPQSPEQEHPAAQPSEAIPGTDTALGEISHDEAACRECGRPYGYKRALGKTGLKEAKMSKTAPEYLFGSPVDPTKEVRIAPEANISRLWPRRTPEKELRALLRERTIDDITEEQRGYVRAIIKEKGRY